MKKNYLSVNDSYMSNMGGFLPCSTLFRIAKTGLSEVPLSLHSCASLRNRQSRLLQSLPQGKISVQNAGQPSSPASRLKSFTSMHKPELRNLVILSVFIVLLVSCKSVPQAAAGQVPAEQTIIEQTTEQPAESLQSEQDMHQSTQDSPDGLSKSSAELPEVSAEPETIQELPSPETQDSSLFTEIQEPEVFDLPAELPQEISHIQEDDSLQKSEQPVRIEKINLENIEIHEIPQENSEETVQSNIQMQEFPVTQSSENSAQQEPTEQNSADSAPEIFPEPSTAEPSDITAESSDITAEVSNTPDEFSSQEELSGMTAEISTETEEQESDTGQNSQTEPQPSRSIQIRRNQYLDIEYPGSGWIYMGENTNEHKLVFFGRRLATDKNPNTAFTLRSRFAGTTLLHFYKNDLLTGSYIDDYLEVIIIDEEASAKEHVKAPSYQEIVPPKPDMSLLKEKNEPFPETPEQKASPELPAVSAKAERSSSASQNSSLSSKQADIHNAEDFSAEKNGKTNIQTTEDIEKPSEFSMQKNQPAISEKTDKKDARVQIPPQAKIPENMNPAAILEQAQKEFDSKNFEKAHLLVNEFFEKSDLDLDKALFLQGQILESNSSVRDIKSAIDAYDALIKNYRRSPLWKKASERSQYLKRFYINIR